VTGSDAGWLTGLPETARKDLAAALSLAEARALFYDWSFWARPAQLPPAGNWRVWLLLAGRGFGKTRTGAELVRARVAGRTARRLALVAPTAADARNVMVEGESGILAISPPWDRPRYEPSKRRLTWPNGAIATLYSADEPERLRGPQHDATWCDELGSWRVGHADAGNAVGERSARRGHHNTAADQADPDADCRSDSGGDAGLDLREPDQPRASLSAADHPQI
jgi:Terminase large subunit, T4likevirus-type, N-terminal